MKIWGDTLHTVEFGVVDNDALGISIDDPWIARRLIKLGHIIQDVKPHPRNKVRTRFIFKKTDTLADDVDRLRQLRRLERG